MMFGMPYLFRGSLVQPLRRLAVVPDRRKSAAAGKGAGDRLYALDLARFVAMLFMMQGHVLDALVGTAWIDVSVFPWNIWHAFRGFTAPVFLMVSGAVHAFASKRGDDGLIREDVLAKRIRWALTIIGIGYLLVMPANRIWDLPFVPSQVWAPALSVNILQLTGVTMLMFVIVMHTTRSVRDMGRRGLLTGLAIVALTPLMQYVPSSILPAWVMSYLNPSTGSLFPIFPFSSFLFFGIAVGAYLHGIPADHRNEHIKRYGWRVGGVMAACATLCYYAALGMGVPDSALTSSTSLLLVLQRLGVVLMIFSASVVILERTWKLRNWYSLFGKKSLYIYVIHLVLLFGTPWFDSIGRTHFRTFDLATGLGFVALIMTSTLILAYAIDRLERFPWKPAHRRILSLAACLLLGWLLMA